MSVTVHLLTRFPPIGFGQLRAEAEAEGFGHIERLANEWEDRSQRFQLDGEALFAALLEDRLSGVGGVTHDPVLPPNLALRVRRVYVRPEGRRQGVGRVLLRRIAQHGLRHAPVLVVNAATPLAAAFFQGCGFTAVEEPGFTHRLTREDDPF
jgi:GNAT superfamily N-acetyltransferase